MLSPKSVRTVRQLMIIVNFVMLSLITGIIIDATAIICNNLKAREFLGNVNNVPRTPVLVVIYLSILLSALFLLMIIRRRYLINREKFLVISCFMEIVICCAVVYVLNMNYKGIFLVAISSVFLYIADNRKKMMLIVISLLLYFFMDHSAINEILRMCAFGDYIQFYPSGARLLFNVLRNLLNSFNEVLFIVFLFMVLQQEIAKSHKLQELYEKLYKNTEELRLANLQLREYALRSEKMAETRERNRLAREIHDTLGHVLTSISTGIEACLMLIDIAPAKTKRQLGLLLGAAREGLIDVRRSVKALRPDALERFKLREALEKLVRNVQGVTNLTVDLAFSEDFDASLSADEEETLYRIVQECITNSVRHGAAKHISVHLCETNGNIHVDIHDNGTGCDTIIEGFGFRHMRERAELLGGTLEFQSKNGFQIKAIIPIRLRGEEIDKNINSG